MLITYKCKYIYPYPYNWIISKDHNHGSLDVISSPHDVSFESSRNKLNPKKSPIFNFDL